MRISYLFSNPETRKAVEAEQQEAKERLGRLSTQQVKVLEQIVAGYSNKIIAYNMGISQRTVENHRAALMMRLEARSIPEVTRLLFLAG